MFWSYNVRNYLIPISSKPGYFKLNRLTFALNPEWMAVSDGDHRPLRQISDWLVDE